MKPNRILQILIGLVAAAHLIVGAALNMGDAASIDAIAGYYGADVETWSPQFLYIVKPLGAFMFALGVVGAVATTNPRKHLLVIYGFSVLFLLRALQRLVFGQEIVDTFGIDSSRNVVNAVFFAAYAIAMIVLARKTSAAGADAAA